MRNLNSMELMAVSGGQEEEDELRQNTVRVVARRTASRDWEFGVMWTTADGNSNHHFFEEGGTVTDFVFEAEVDPDVAEFLEDLVNNEIATFDDLTERLEALSASDREHLSDFLSAMEAWSDRNIAITAQLGGTALALSEVFSDFSKMLGAAGAVLDAVSLGIAISDGDFTLAEQADALAAFTSIGIGLAAGASLPAALLAVLVAVAGDDLVELVVNDFAPAVQSMLDDAQQNFADAYSTLLGQTPVSPTTGSLDIPTVFGAGNGYEDLYTNPNGGGTETY